MECPVQALDGASTRGDVVGLVSHNTRDEAVGAVRMVCSPHVQ